MKSELEAWMREAGAFARGGIVGGRDETRAFAEHGLLGMVREHDRDRLQAVERVPFGRLTGGRESAEETVRHAEARLKEKLSRELSRMITDAVTVERRRLEHQGDIELFGRLDIARSRDGIFIETPGGRGGYGGKRAMGAWVDEIYMAPIKPTPLPPAPPPEPKLDPKDVDALDENLGNW